MEAKCLAHLLGMPGGGGGVGVVAVGEVSHGDMLPPVVRLLKKAIVSSLLSEACGGGE